MTNGEQKYYENYLALFDTEGWKQLMSEVEASISNLEKTAIRASSADFEYNKGYVGSLDHLLAHEAVIRAAYVEATTEYDDADL